MTRIAASSVKACYLLLGCLGSIQATILSPTMAWDKMVERLIGIRKLALRIIFDSKAMIITVKRIKVERLYQLLKDSWN